MLTRADEFLMAGHRPGAYQKVKAGATKDGKLVALSALQYEMGGVGGGGVAGLPYIYRVPKVFRERATLHTHQDGGRAMRGPGHPQASFAMEAMMDDLAYAIGMDRLLSASRTRETRHITGKWTRRPKPSAGRTGPKFRAAARPTARSNP